MDGTPHDSPRPRRVVYGDEEPELDNSKYAWLGGYVCINSGLTFTNKILLKNYAWRHPEVLALWHLTVTAFGSLLLVRVLGAVKPAKLAASTYPKLALFSMLFNLNILMSVISLDLVSMAAHQVIRALMPAFTIAISFLLLGKRSSRKIIRALGLLFCGVCVYTLVHDKDPSGKGLPDRLTTTYGLGLTLLGTLLASFKGVMSNVFMVGPLQLEPLDFVTYMSTLAALQLYVYVQHTGKLDSALHELCAGDCAAFLAARPNGDGAGGGDRSLLLALVGNGLLAFGLNVIALTANKASTPLLCNVGSTLKKILTIVVGFVMSWNSARGDAGWAQVLGLTITCCGITLYAKEEYSAQQDRTAKRLKFQ